MAAVGDAAGDALNHPLAVEVRGPVVHQPPPTPEQVGPRIGRLDLVLNQVSQRRPDHLAWRSVVLPLPVPPLTRMLRRVSKVRSAAAGSGPAAAWRVSRGVGGGRVVGVARLGLQLVDARVRHVGDLRHGEQVVAAETARALPAVTVPVESGGYCQVEADGRF